MPKGNLHDFLPAIRQAKHVFHRLLVIDSSSSDRTRELVASEGFEVIQIPRSEFDHGGTHQLGVEALPDCDVIVCMTQDAILANENAIPSLIAPFSDPEIAATFGRQLPRVGASLLEAYSRNFSYGDTSIIKSWPESSHLGIMAGAISNSFAAYRRESLMKVGGFSKNLVCTEDAYVGFKLIFNKMKIAYVAESEVYHSHDYSLFEEFRRYFDIGAFYCAFEPWILKTTGAPEERGAVFLMHQMRTIFFREPWQLPKCIASAFMKYLGYRMGAKWHWFPLKIRIILGMNKAFWGRSGSMR